MPHRPVVRRKPSSSTTPRSRFGVEPQQIQRYEASDYQTASFARLREIARLLGLPHSPPKLDKEVYKFQGQPVLAREALRYTFTHMAHHRGQAEVYLRVKNIKPPAWRF